MKRITLCLLIATMMIICYGCGAESGINNDDILATKQIVELIEMGIPEAFIADLEVDDIDVMYQELNGTELGEVKFNETSEGDLRLNMLIVPVSVEGGVRDCIRIYSTYQWSNSGITIPRSNEMKVSWDEEYFLLGDDRKLTRSYKVKADESKMKCTYDESRFAKIRFGAAHWYHPIKFGVGKHLQKGVSGMVLIPVDGHCKVLATDQAEKIETEISLEYIVHGLVKANAEKETYKASDKTELYKTE